MPIPHSFFKNQDPSKFLFFCFGNRDRADDAIGLIIGDELVKIYPQNVFTEEYEDISTIILDLIEKEQYSHLVIIDAIDFGGQPGSIIVSSKITETISPISTHSIPYQQLKFIVENQNKIFVLIGVQVKSVEFMKEVSAEVLTAVDKVLDFLKA